MKNGKKKLKKAMVITMRKNKDELSVAAINEMKCNCKKIEESVYPFTYLFDLLVNTGDEELLKAFQSTVKQIKVIVGKAKNYDILSKIKEKEYSKMTVVQLRAESERLSNLYDNILLEMSRYAKAVNNICIDSPLSEKLELIGLKLKQVD